MFYLYLESLQEKRNNAEIIDTITELNNVTQRMNAMLSEVGKKIIDKDEYDKIRDEQAKIAIEFFIEQIFHNLEFKVILSESLKPGIDSTLSKIFYDEYLDNPFNQKDFVKGFGESSKYLRSVNNLFAAIDPNIEIQHINYFKVFVNYHNKIKPLLKNFDLHEYFMEVLRQKISEYLVDDLPF